MSTKNVSAVSVNKSAERKGAAWERRGRSFEVENLQADAAQKAASGQRRKRRLKSITELV